MAEAAALAAAVAARNRGWEHKRRGMYGPARDEFTSAVEVVAGYQSTAAKRARANALRGRSTVLRQFLGLCTIMLAAARADVDAASPGIDRLRSMCLTERGHSYLDDNPGLAATVPGALEIALRDQAGAIPAPRITDASMLPCGTLDLETARNNVANALVKLSRLAEAEPRLDVGEPRTALTAQLNWAGACLSQSQSQQAAGHWREALRLARKVGNP